jgi:hypothetical protein
MFRHVISFRTFWLLLAALLVAPNAARAADSYFMIIFGQQGGANQVDLSHTFATFVKSTGEGPNQAKYSIEVHTISWMPRSLDVKLLKRPEGGVNLDLKESLRVAKSVRAEVTMWGSFHIKKELYDRALQQITRLNAGDIGYKALDNRFRPNSATNCIHAVSDIDIDEVQLGTGTAYGNEASLMVLTHLSRWIIDYDETNDWIAQRLELGKDIVRREFKPIAPNGLKK